MGTAAMRPIEPTTSIATTASATASKLIAVRERGVGEAEDEQDGQGRAGVGEDESVDGRGDVVVADGECAAEEAAEVEARVGASERHHDR
jgi:hypothetical protein